MKILAAIKAARGQKNAGAYISPTQRIAAIRAQLSGNGEPDAAVNANISQGAENYAQKRLGQFSQIADLLGGDFANAVHSMGSQEDAPAAYRNLSGLFAKQSQAQGIQDPRVLLQQLLMQAHGGQQPQHQPMLPAPQGSPGDALAARSAALNQKYGLNMRNAYTDGRKARG
jgi:hypothetical protein